MRPILIERCVQCHGAEKSKGGLRLDLRTGWQNGGDQGPAIMPGNPEESLVIRAVRYEDEALKMPPGGMLPLDEIQALERWVREGAVDPRDGGKARLGGMTLEEARNWWSLRPLSRPQVPDPATSPDPASNPIDAFVNAPLGQSQLAPSAPADRRTLIRRVSYDLTGLPPSAEEVEAFVNDPSPLAYVRVVDRLLTSPHYGERWGKHWLDLVRYADTAGENSDHPVPQAWRYRNWVFDAYNQDLPYDTFLKMQLAGDLLARDGLAANRASAVVATGFLAIARRFGHDIDKDMHLTHEDVIDTFGKSILGLSIGCARCHSHKYDPISTEDYYALYGIFASTNFAFPGCEPQQRQRDLVPLASPEEWESTIKPHLERESQLERQLKQLEDRAQSQANRWKQGLARSVTLASADLPEGGKFAWPGNLNSLLEPLVVQKGQVLLLTVHPRGNYGADSTRIECVITPTDQNHPAWNLTEDVLDTFLSGNPLADRAGRDTVWWLLDLRGPRLLDDAVERVDGKQGLHAWRHGDVPSAFINQTNEEIAAWTRLPARAFFVHPAPDGPVGVAWMSPITGPVRVSGSISDAHPAGGDGVAWHLQLLPAELTAVFQELHAIRGERTALLQERAALQARRPAQELAYAVSEGTPQHARIQLRGDPEKPGTVVPRRWLQVLGGQPVTQVQGSGRRELADWVADRANPLTTRVMVNRIWQHHFGAGLVRSPNDFGSRGEQPSHPELLDWLASQLIDQNWQLKPLHRLILLSNAYQRSSFPSSPSQWERDPENRWLARFARRRLSAEELRDSLLVASGQLDHSPAQAHPFPPESTWNFTQHQPFQGDYSTRRRGAYLMIQRTRRDPFLTLFDGADPNATTPLRQETTVPSQALFFLNAPFFHEQAELLARRQATAANPAQNVHRLFRAILLRSPTPAEEAWAIQFVSDDQAVRKNEPPAAKSLDPDQEHWAALTRVLLSSNSFLYLD